MAQEQQPPPDATHSECGVDASPLKVWQPANRISSEEATSLIYYLGGISLLGLGAFLILQFIFREQPVRPSKPFVKIPKNDAPVDVDE